MSEGKGRGKRAGMSCCVGEMTGGWMRGGRVQRRAVGTSEVMMRQRDERCGGCGLLRRRWRGMGRERRLCSQAVGEARDGFKAKT